MSTSPLTLAAIDVGYGHTKFCMRTPSGTLIEDSFTSFAPSATPDQLAGGSGLTRLRVMQVEAQGRSFSVGPDAALLSDGRQERSCTPDYPRTPQYAALVKGALAMMRQPSIDLLVLGLPVTTLALHREFLEQTFTGSLEVPANPVLGVDSPTKVHVRKVVVMAQPAAALVGMAVEMPHVASSNSMVLDLGYFTLDFLVAKNLRPAPNRSGAVEGGMSGYLDQLHKAAGKEHVKLYGGIPGRFRMGHADYEQALLRDDKVLQTSAGPLDLHNPTQAAGAKLDEYLEAVAAKITKTEDINHVLLAGGGAQVLRPRIKAMFPDLVSILIPRRPQFSIMQGMLQAAANLTGVRQ